MSIRSFFQPCRELFGKEELMTLGYGALARGFRLFKALWWLAIINAVWGSVWWWYFKGAGGIAAMEGTEAFLMILPTVPMLFLATVMARSAAPRKDWIYIVAMFNQYFLGYLMVSPLVYLYVRYNSILFFWPMMLILLFFLDTEGSLVRLEQATKNGIITLARFLPLLLAISVIVGLLIGVLVGGGFALLYMVTTKMPFMNQYMSLLGSGCSLFDSSLPLSSTLFFGVLFLFSYVVSTAGFLALISLAATVYDRISHRFGELFYKGL